MNDLENHFLCHQGEIESIRWIVGSPVDRATWCFPVRPRESANAFRDAASSISWYVATKDSRFEVHDLHPLKGISHLMDSRPDIQLFSPQQHEALQD